MIRSRAHAAPERCHRRAPPSSGCRSQLPTMKRGRPSLARPTALLAASRGTPKTLLRGSCPKGPNELRLDESRRHHLNCSGSSLSMWALPFPERLGDSAMQNEAWRKIESDVKGLTLVEPAGGDRRCASST